MGMARMVTHLPGVGVGDSLHSGEIRRRHDGRHRLTRKERGPTGAQTADLEAGVLYRNKITVAPLLEHNPFRVHAVDRAAQRLSDPSQTEEQKDDWQPTHSTAFPLFRISLHYSRRGDFTLEGEHSSSKEKNRSPFLGVSWRQRELLPVLGSWTTPLATANENLSTLKFAIWERSGDRWVLKEGEFSTSPAPAPPPLSELGDRPGPLGAPQEPPVRGLRLSSRWGEWAVAVWGHACPERLDDYLEACHRLFWQEQDQRWSGVARDLLGGLSQQRQQIAQTIHRHTAQALTAARLELALLESPPASLVQAIEAASDSLVQLVHQQLSTRPSGHDLRALVEGELEFQRRWLERPEWRLPREPLPDALAALWTQVGGSVEPSDHDILFRTRDENP